MSLLLIDGDIVAFRAAAACQKTRYLVTLKSGEVFERDNAVDAKKLITCDSDYVWKREENQPLDQAIFIAEQYIRDIEARYRDENLKTRVFLSPSVGNYREQLATRAKYKGNRDAVPRPKHLKDVVARLVERGAEVADRQEADDSLGIEATANPGSVIASNDKDLRQIPGRHFDFVKKEEFEVTQKQAVKFFYQQVLTGDATDNIPGIHGVGEKKAIKLLAECKNPLDCWNACVLAYEFAGMGVAEALEAARLVYIRKLPDELWEPPTNPKFAYREA